MTTANENKSAMIEIQNAEFKSLGINSFIIIQQLIGRKDRVEEWIEKLEKQSQEKVD